MSGRWADRFGSLAATSTSETGATATGDQRWKPPASWPKRASVAVDDGLPSSRGTVVERRRVAHSMNAFRLPHGGMMPVSLVCKNSCARRGMRVKAEAARSNRAGRMACSSHFSKPEMPKSAPFVPRTLPPLPPVRPTSRAQREREAKAYWDSLTQGQEIWALRKVGYFKIGELR
jgi:hypothetical protein